MKNITLLLLSFLILSCQGSKPAKEKTGIIFAAASTTDVILELAQKFKEKSDIELKFNFAASSTLARQIESGAEFDVFISANQKWIKYLQEKKLVSETKDLFSNQLVLIVPFEESFEVRLFPQVLQKIKESKGLIAIGDPSHVPAGIYAKQSLEHFGVWEEIQSRVIPSLDVREALRLVEMGEANFGVVYATDALVSPKVETVGTFPEESHEPIIYLIGLAPDLKIDNNDFYSFLFSTQAKEVFIEHGFSMDKKLIN